MEATGVSVEEAENVLSKTKYNCKMAIFMIISKSNLSDAKRILNENNGYIRKALKEVKNGDL